VHFTGGAQCGVGDVLQLGGVRFGGRADRRRGAEAAELDVAREGEM